MLAAEGLPDLVVFSGDQISGWVSKGADGWAAQHWERATTVVRAASAPYAAILGNHDAEADLGRKELLEMDARLGAGLSLSRPGPDNITGASNSWLDVAAPGGGRAAVRLWLLESMATIWLRAGSRELVCWQRQSRSARRGVAGRWGWN